MTEFLDRLNKSLALLEVAEDQMVEAIANSSRSNSTTRLAKSRLCARHSTGRWRICGPRCGKTSRWRKIYEEHTGNIGRAGNRRGVTINWIQWQSNRIEQSYPR